MKLTQPEQNYDEWCTDCKEYDKDKHCCPRWNRVIRNTLKDAVPKRKNGKWEVYETKDGLLRRCTCSECGFTTHGKTWVNPNYCSNCGADMREGE